MSHTYKLRYDPQHEVGEFQRDQAEGKGLADALVMCSLLFPEDGSFSFQAFSVDGRTGGGLESMDMFRVWTTMTAQIERDVELPPAYRQAASTALQAIRDAMGIEVQK